MKKENNIDFVSILQNETFIKRIEFTNGSENQLEILEKEFPGQREAIAHAIEFIKANVSDQKLMQPHDVNLIWQNIREYENQSRKFTLQQFVYHHLWKVAAIFIILASSSYGIYQYTRMDQLTRYAKMEVAATNEAMIVLSDGSNHLLGVNESHIEYAKDGGEVIVKGKKSSEERITNKGNNDELVINQIVVPFGRRHSITLSDGTQVHLNSGSKLVFPAEFKGNTREVYLKGEGYFEVEKNPLKPFIVKTDHLDIKVLGTVFNISAYGDDQMVSTVLVEGKVNVTQKNKLFKNQEYTLQPGQGCFYSLTSDQSEVKKVNLADYILWKDGLYQFHNRPLKQIVEMVKKYYNITITIENEKIANTVISGKLVLSDDSNEVLDYLAKTLEARYTKTDQSTFRIME